MIKCPKCGSELPDEAKFCFNCGADVKWENKCPSCGMVNLPNAKFCIECGTPLTAQNVQTNESVHNMSSQSASAGGSSQAVFEKMDKIVPIIMWCVSGALALFSFIFVLASGITTSSGNVSVTTSIFNLIYSEDMQSIIDILNMGYSSDTAYYEYLLAANIVVSIACVALLLTIGILAGNAISKWIKFRNDRSINVSSIGVNMFLVMFVGTSFIGGMFSFEAVSNSSSSTTGVSGATIAGYVIGFILLAIYVACKLYQMRDKFNVNRIVSIACTAAAIIFVLVFVGIVGGPVLKYSNSGGKLGYGYLRAMGLSSTAFSFGFFGVVMSLAVLIIALFALKAMLCSMLGEKSLKSSVVFLSVMLGLVALYSAAAIAFQMDINGEATNGFGTNVAGVIVTSLLGLIAIITAKVFSKKEQAASNYLGLSA